jgi:hypothetical protein
VLRLQLPRRAEHLGGLVLPESGGGRGREREPARRVARQRRRGERAAVRADGCDHEEGWHRRILRVERREMLPQALQAVRGPAPAAAGLRRTAQHQRTLRRQRAGVGRARRVGGTVLVGRLWSDREPAGGASQEQQERGARGAPPHFVVAARKTNLEIWKGPPLLSRESAYKIRAAYKGKMQMQQLPARLAQQLQGAARAHVSRAASMQLTTLARGVHAPGAGFLRGGALAGRAAGSCVASQRRGMCAAATAGGSSGDAPYDVRTTPT